MSTRLVVRHGDGERVFTDGPDRGRVLVLGGETGGAYGLMELTVAPVAADDYGAHLHHGCEETFLVRRGRLEFLLGDEMISLGPGDFVRAPRGVRHGYANRSGEPVELLVSFHPGGLESLFLKNLADAAFKAEANDLFGSVFDLD